jgi:hypothetical protein
MNSLAGSAKKNSHCEERFRDVAISTTAVSYKLKAFHKDEIASLRSQ